jgi:hypothetical protein
MREFSEIKGKGRVVLMSCGEDEIYVGWFFEEYLVEGLKGFSDSNEDGVCTAEEAFTYIEQHHPDMWSWPTIYDGYPGELPLTVVELPPEPCKMVGPEVGKTEESYTYILSSIDPEGDDVRYYVDWGDGTEGWTDFFRSGEKINISHRWQKEGTCNVAFKTEDEHGAEGNWSSERLAVTVTSENIIDQRQTDPGVNCSVWNIFWLYPLHKDFWIAQSFKPNVSRLTKIEIELEVCVAKDPIYVCLKRNLYDEEDLVNVSLVPEASVILPFCILPWWTRWYTFDFPEIEVVPGDTYYIVIKSFNKINPRYNRILGAFIPNNPYPRGETYYSIDQGRSWHDPTDRLGAEVDTCFVTYGGVG